MDFEKIRSGKRLTREEGLALFRETDLLAVGRRADVLKHGRHGKAVRFVVNRQINPTNLCALRCPACDFGVSEGDPAAYELSREEILSHCEGPIHEIHLVGGLHPKWSFERYLEIVQWIHRARPDVPLKAFTAVEIDWFAKQSGFSIEAVLERLRDTGVSMLAGGGAEIFAERVRNVLFPNKIGADRWLEIHRTAHRFGIPTNATMLFGHIETIEERVDHLLRLRELQDETGGFSSFIPLAYQPGRGGFAPFPPSAVDCLRTVAVSRLLFDNVAHVKAYWVMLGEATAALALRFGASDIDGTIGRERVAHAAGVATPEGMTRDRVIRIIRSSGSDPVERDALYRDIVEEVVAGALA